MEGFSQQLVATLGRKTLRVSSMKFTNVSIHSLHWSYIMLVKGISQRIDIFARHVTSKKNRYQFNIICFLKSLPSFKFLDWLRLEADLQIQISEARKESWPRSLSILYIKCSNLTCFPKGCWIAADRTPCQAWGNLKICISHCECL